MSILIVFEGPEKAGKSTVLSAAKSRLEEQGYSVRIHHWGPIKSEVEYFEPLKADLKGPEQVVLWDRAWASEHVYAKLMRRKRLLGTDPWFGEWWFSRPTRTVGSLVMLLPEDVEKNISMRDGTDLPVNPKREIELFRQYAERFNWNIWLNPYTPEFTEVAVARVLAEVHRIEQNIQQCLPAPFPPNILGPLDPESPVIITGKAREENWLSKTEEKIGRLLGDSISQFTWVVAHQCPPQALRNYKTFIPVGDVAINWVNYYVVPRSNQVVLEVKSVKAWQQVYDKAYLTTEKSFQG